MFHTGLDPRDMSPVYVPKDPKEKAMQRALMQYHLPEYRQMARQALKAAHREDLIGFGKDCILPPYDGPRERADDRRRDEAHGKGRDNSRGKAPAKPERRGEKRTERRSTPKHGDDRRNAPKHGPDRRGDAPKGRSRRGR